MPLLLVDDDEAIVEMMKLVLESEGYSVEEAFTGSEAVEKVRNRAYRMAILDYVLPDIYGDVVAERIREIAPDLPLVLLTGYRSSIREDSLGSFNVILDKPTHPDVLLSTIRAYATKRAPG